MNHQETNRRTCRQFPERSYLSDEEEAALRNWLLWLALVQRLKLAGPLMGDQQ